MITLKYIPGQPVVKVTYTEGNSNTTKNIPYDSINDFFLSQRMSTKDTGYMSTNLVREIITESTIKRMYHYPELVVQLSASVIHDPTTVRRNYVENPHFKIISLGDRNAIQFPIFKLKNIVAFTSNNNNSNKNIIGYSINFAKPSLSNILTNDTHIVRSLFGNHYDRENLFESTICWPTGISETVGQTLSSNNTNTQAGFVRLYFSSRFNFDLQRANLRDNVSNFVNSNEGFKQFLSTCFNIEYITSGSADGESTLFLYLYIYYQYNILANPELDFMDKLREIGRSTTLGQIFR